ncbi:hypothetical protein H721_03207 [Brucella ovis IntaBari-2006-46-332]|uniref:Hydrolase, haloacid dehalogenase-like family n=1 Tax=Brucella ovis (strain ATCC 25840 / 63/290 / NCTC 10512) TaxID=444178 RepID=A0A0H3AVJ1_BRUO2|nr:HAD-IA family hydrolase [Brucella ovis]ABQ62581.1 conserved hypothetical protein [Brucella ovis ATCC 25840]ENR02045.1 HAD hydrolase, family IA [Brucella ovis 80/125]ENR05243.1 HAD hydrolase, family IA [Brucella ovis F8/05B]ENS93850.1 HAD hydrolase, family IA [Brucella ovis 63/96]ENS95446.1 HAD hydrolase, family IA [Brucella ovis 81/8]
MSKALILDFGGVVTRTLFETHDITERALGLPAGSLGWKGPFDPSTDPRAYEQVLAELALDRADCVFVDDQKKNIEGAEAVHLPHVHFDVTRPAESYAQALKMLGI